MTDERPDHAVADSECPVLKAIASSRYVGNLVHLLARTAHIAVSAAAFELRAHGVSLRQLAVLDALAATGPLTQNELGNHLGIDRTTMVAVIDSLSALGLVVRQSHPTDRRAYAVTVTAEGRLQADEAFARLSEIEDVLAEGLTAAETRDLKDFLRRISTGRKETSGTECPGFAPPCGGEPDAEHR